MERGRRTGRDLFCGRFTLMAKKIFDGIRILDVTQYLAGPVAARLFVDLGAEVIKVEPPPKGEGSRLLRFSADDGPKGAPAAYFSMHNRGKKCICVDFKRPEGAAILKDLAKTADVFFQNYTPGVLARYGLGYRRYRGGQSTNCDVLRVHLRTGRSLCAADRQ